MLEDEKPGGQQHLVPVFDDFLGAAVQQLRFDPSGTPDVTVLGDAEGLATARIAARLPQAVIAVIDPSQGALDAARKRAGEHTGLTFQTGDLRRARLPKPADAVLSLLATQAFTAEEKIDFYSRTYQTLRPGGVLVHATRVAGEDEVLHQRQHWAWLSDIRARGVSEPEIAAALDEMQADQLSPLSVHLDWMRQIGFTHVDCSFRRGMFAVLSGEMPRNPAERPRNLFSVGRMLKRR